MLKRNLLAAAILLLTLPALAQVTTTVTTDLPPPPPQAAAPSTQVVVNPPQNSPPVAAPPPADVPPAVIVSNPPPPVLVRDDGPGIQAVPSGRSAGSYVALDALYGGVAGGLIGGGVTLIDQGNNWGRDLMVGAGVGILVGSAYGIFEAATQTRVPARAIADRNPAASDSLGVAPAQYALRF
jgi:hypothetical protein